MLNNQLKKLALTKEETLTEVVDCLSKHISINSNEARNPESLFQVLVRAASKQDTVENTCKELNQATSGNNIRYHLGKISDFIQLEKQLNLALKTKISQGLKNKNLIVAIDLNLIPYYGKLNDSENPYIYRSQVKDGTCSFYSYATLYTVKKGKRVTLAIKSIRFQDTQVCIWRYCPEYFCLAKKWDAPNENFALDMVNILRSLGYYVITSYDTRQANQGIPDDRVLNYATQNGLILITFNRDDFIKLHQSGLKHAGIIICKTDRDYQGQITKLHEYLQNQTILTNRLIRIKKQNQRGLKQQIFVVQEY